MDHETSHDEQESKAVDRRGPKRFQVAWPVKVRGIDNDGVTFEETAELLDLSSAAARVRVSRKLEVGSQAEVLIRVPLRAETWMSRLGTVTRMQNSPGKQMYAINFPASRPRFIVGSQAPKKGTNLISRPSSV
jgi:hypothetical protein